MISKGITSGPVEISLGEGSKIDGSVVNGGRGTAGSSEK